MSDFINQVEPDITLEDIENVSKYMNSGAWITEHKQSEVLASMIKDKVGRTYSTFVPNGTIAIYLSILANNLDNGKRIAVPNLTMIATINAVLWANSIPVLVDTDESLCMSLEALKKENDLDGAIFVPLNGRTGSGLEIEKYCDEAKITLIEDSAHALGSKYEKKSCGSLGNTSIFSFTPHKIITMGQGGLVLTDSEEVFHKIQSLKLFNRNKDKMDWHDGFGLNFKITDLQASLGISQFARLENYIINKKNNYKIISDTRSDNYHFISFNDYETPWFNDIVFSSIQAKEEFQKKFKENNIETREFYPALSYQGYLSKYRTDRLSYSENVFAKLLWLPSSNNLSKQQIEKIKLVLTS